MKKNFIRILSFVLVVVLAGALFVACDKKDDKDDKKKDSAPNKDPKKAEEALKEAGYDVIYTEVNDGGIKAYVVASKGKDSIQIAYYDDKDTAAKAYEQAKEAYEELKEIAEASGEDFDYVVKQSGTMVYMGTKQAVKDAK